MAGKQIDLLAEKHVSGAGTLRLAIECKYRTEGMVSNAQVHHFANVVQLLRRSDGIAKGVLVTPIGFTKDAYLAKAQ